jgi:hypothetical protein
LPAVAVGVVRVQLAASEGRRWLPEPEETFLSLILTRL